MSNIYTFAGDQRSASESHSSRAN